MPEAVASSGGHAAKDTRQRLEGLRTALQDAIMRRMALEPSARVRAVLKDGAALAAELNAALAGDGMPSDDERAMAWASTEESVQAEVATLLAKLEEMQQAAEQEPDVLRKQALLVRSRDASAKLARVSASVKDIGSALNLVVGFLNVMDKKLQAIDSKLDALQEGVRAMHADLKRLVGRPVLEVIAEQREEVLKRHRKLRSKVYIPIEGVGAGPDGKFIKSNGNGQLQWF